jgi:hypothetical protein
MSYYAHRFRMKKFLLLAICSAGCAHLETYGAPEPKFAEDVVLDVDLTQGNAGPGQVTGGKWEGGWRVTSRKGERIVFDAGHPMANGRLEVTYTMSKPAHQAPEEKIEFIGLYEDPSLSQEKSSGDIFYARAGEARYKYARVKAFGRKFDKQEWENDVGRGEDWVPDDKTVQTVKLEWKLGRAIFHDVHDKLHACPKKLCGGKFPIDKLRYVALGSDEYSNVSLDGIRFLHVKLVEYKPAAP